MFLASEINRNLKPKQNQIWRLAEPRIDLKLNGIYFASQALDVTNFRTMRYERFRSQ